MAVMTSFLFGVVGEEDEWRELMILRLLISVMTSFLFGVVGGEDEWWRAMILRLLMSVMLFSFFLEGTELETVLAKQKHSIQVNESLYTKGLGDKRYRDRDQNRTEEIPSHSFIHSLVSSRSSSTVDAFARLPISQFLSPDRLTDRMGLDVRLTVSVIVIVQRKENGLFLS